MTRVGSTLWPLGLLGSNPNSMPATWGNRPSSLGYADTPFSKAWSSCWPVVYWGQYVNWKSLTFKNFLNDQYHKWLYSFLCLIYMFYPIFTEKLKSPEKVCFKCLHSGCISIFHFHQRGHTTVELRDHFLETINFSLVMFFHGFKLVYW